MIQTKISCDAVPSYGSYTHGKREIALRDAIAEGDWWEIGSDGSVITVLRLKEGAESRTAKHACSADCGRTLIWQIAETICPDKPEPEIPAVAPVEVPAPSKDEDIPY